MSKDKKINQEIEQNAGIRKREEELEKKRSVRVKKTVAFVGIVFLLGAGAYVSRVAYLDQVQSADQSVIALNSMYYGPANSTQESDDMSQQLEEEVAETSVEATTEAVAEQTTETESIIEETSEEETSVEETSEEQTTEEETTSEEATSEDVVETDISEKKTKTEYLCISSINVNLRSKPSPSGSVVGKILPKTTVTVLDHNTSGWYHVSYNGMEGYVIDKALVQQ